MVNHMCDLSVTNPLKIYEFFIMRKLHTTVCPGFMSVVFERRYR